MLWDYVQKMTLLKKIWENVFRFVLKINSLKIARENDICKQIHQSNVLVRDFTTRNNK